MEFRIYNISYIYLNINNYNKKYSIRNKLSMKSKIKRALFCMNF